MSARTAQAWHQAAFNAGQKTKRREAERRAAKYETHSNNDFAYSGTYLRNNADGSIIPETGMAQNAVGTTPESIPFSGATVSMGPLSVGMRVADSRTHYTNAVSDHTDSDNDANQSQNEAICEEAKTFGGPRSVTSGWSNRIQRRFFLTVKQYDLTPVEQSVDPLAFIVLKFPEGMRTNKELVNRALRSLFEAIRYKLGNRSGYPLVWNIEFTWLGVAHINLLLAFPETSYDWLLRTWTKRAKHAAGTAEIDVLHVTRPGEVDAEGCLRDFQNKFFSFVAYMAGLGDVLGFVKAHQYNVPGDWADEGTGSGRMWGVQGMGRAKVSTYPIENIKQKEAIQAYLRQFCPEKLVEYTDPKTGVVTVYNDGAFSETRRAGSLQCLMVTAEMHDRILDLLERHASIQPSVKPLADLAVALAMSVEELMTPPDKPLYSFA